MPAIKEKRSAKAFCGYGNAPRGCETFWQNGWRVQQRYVFLKSRGYICAPAWSRDDVWSASLAEENKGVFDQAPSTRHPPPTPFRPWHGYGNPWIVGNRASFRWRMPARWFLRFEGWQAAASSAYAAFSFRKVIVKNFGPEAQASVK